MSAHIVLSFLAIMTFYYLLYQANKTKTLPFLLLFLLFALIFPLAYSGISVIAHFLFVSTQNYSLWFAAFYALLCADCWRLLKRTKGTLAYGWHYLCLIGLIFSIWIGYVIFQSQYEPGVKTPKISDSFWLFSYWCSVQIYLISVLTLLWKKSNATKNLYARITLILCSVLYAFILYFSLVS